MRGLEPMITDLNIQKTFHEHKLWNLLYLIQMMVHHIDSKWHHIVSSLVAAYKKLVGLGFVRYNDEIHIIEPMEKQKYV